MDPSQVEKTTMDRETMDPSEGETTKDLMSKAEEFMKNYFAKFTESCGKMAAEELAEKKLAEKEFAEKKLTKVENIQGRKAILANTSLKLLANLYRKDAVMTFDGENIQGGEAILAKLTSLNLSRIQVLNIKCLPVGGTGFDSGTGFDGGSGTGFDGGSGSGTGFDGGSSTVFDSGSGTGFVCGTGFSGGFGGVGCGYIWLDGKQDARFFSQMIVLHPTPEGSFDISHSIFSTVPKLSGSALALSNGIFHTGHESSGATLASSKSPYA